MKKLFWICLLLWKMDFPKQGIGVVVAVFILIDFEFLFSLIGVFDKATSQEPDNIIENTIPEVQYSQQAGEIHFTSAELEEILLINKYVISWKRFSISFFVMYSVSPSKTTAFRKFFITRYLFLCSF